MLLIEFIFCALVVVFLFILGQFFVPEFRDFFKGSLVFLLPFAAFCLLGAVLIFLTFKKKVGGKLRRFLILTGASAVGFFASVVLHNFFYALGVLTNNIFVLHYLFEFLHGAFFIIGLLVCPVGFLVGGMGSIFCFLKKK